MRWEPWHSQRFPTVKKTLVDVRTTPTLQSTRREFFGIVSFILPFPMTSCLSPPSMQFPTSTLLQVDDYIYSTKQASRYLLRNSRVVTAALHLWVEISTFSQPKEFPSNSTTYSAIMFRA